MTKAKIIRQYFKKFYNVDVEGMTPIAALRDAYYKVWGVRADNATDIMYVKVGGSWMSGIAVYKKVSGSWVLQNDLTQIFENGVNYKVN